MQGDQYHQEQQQQQEAPAHCALHLHTLHGSGYTANLVHKAFE
jgi:hypothetical protein